VTRSVPGRGLKVMAYRRFFVLTAAVLAALLPMGCTSRQPVPPKTVLTTGFGVLVSAVNGLYYPPFLRDETAGPEANSYALRIRLALGDGPVQLSVSAQSAAELRGEALDASPLWGRWWLAPLAKAGVGGLLSARDVSAVRTMRSAQGYFAEPGAESGDSYRASATAAALEILALRDAVTADDRRVTGAWLLAAAGRGPSVQTAADLVRGFTALAMTVPAGLGAVADIAPVDFSRLDEQGRYRALLDAYSSSVITQALGRPARVDRGVWANVLRHNFASLGYGDLYYLVVAATAAGVPAADFAGVRQRITGETLPDNSVRDSGSLTGSPEASLFVLRLRGMAGESTADPGQVTALRRAFTAHRDLRPDELLSLDAALWLAGDRSVGTTLHTLCVSGQAVPAVVTPADAEWWSRAALACADAGVTVRAPASGSWSLQEPATVTAAATLVNGLGDAGIAGHRPAWVTAKALRGWATNPERLPTTSAYATVVRAYLLLGGTADPAIRAAVGRAVDSRQGCAQLPGLYRADDSGSGCDLKATWAVWKLSQRLDGHLPAVTLSTTKQDR
jgi:hypothetical protein